MRENGRISTSSGEFNMDKTGWSLSRLSVQHILPVGIKRWQEKTRDFLDRKLTIARSLTLVKYGR